MGSRFVGGQCAAATDWRIAVMTSTKPPGNLQLNQIIAKYLQAVDPP